MASEAVWPTPFELGNGNQTTTWEECIAFYERLAAQFSRWLSLHEVGVSDGGRPIHLGVFSADGCMDLQRIKAAGRCVLFNNNGIHPGEPEGIDACMALVRDLCIDESVRAALGATVLLFVPVYNVDGACNRANTSRVNQIGPEQFGFRGNARHLDLNRDFVKQDSRNAAAFASIFAVWDPDVMIDTHTSNGADYQYTMTLIATQPDKLGGETGRHLRERMLPALYARMQAAGHPMCPYVNTLHETPEEGIADFLDTPRFSTGYAALHHTIGFMPETHMLKTFAQRCHATRALLDAVMAYVREHGAAVRDCRARDRAAFAPGSEQPLSWQLDETRPTRFRFLGYRARREASRIGHYRRLRYDRSQPFEADIAYFDRYRFNARATVPRAYLLPQAWPEIATRLRSHGVGIVTLTDDRTFVAQALRIVECDKSPRPFEGRHLCTHLRVDAVPVQALARAGDALVPLGGPHDRLVFEMLEPMAHDSFFRWGFFDAVLDRKETFSDYVFEDEAERLLAQDGELAAAFKQWKTNNPDQLGSAQAVLGFLHRHSKRYAEPEWMTYPVLRVVAEAP